MAETSTLITAEQLREMAQDQRVELVRGQLVEMPPRGWEEGTIVPLLVSWLVPFVMERKLGQVNCGLGFILARNPDLVRGPDIALISAARLAGAPARGFFAGAPDLAVEVVSPLARVSEMQRKIREYLNAGSRLVWLVDPLSETVTAYHPSGDAHVYSGTQEVTGEDVLPGFSFRAADLFS